MNQRATEVRVRFSLRAASCVLSCHMCRISYYYHLYLFSFFFIELIACLVLVYVCVRRSSEGELCSSSSHHHHHAAPIFIYSDCRYCTVLVSVLCFYRVLLVCMSRLLAGVWTVIVTWRFLSRREVDIVLTFTSKLCYSCVRHRNNGRVFLCFFPFSFLKKMRMYCFHYFLRF